MLMCNTQDAVDHFTFSRNISGVITKILFVIVFIHFKSDSHLKPGVHVPMAIKTSRSRCVPSSLLFYNTKKRQ